MFADTSVKRDQVEAVNSDGQPIGKAHHSTTINCTRCCARLFFFINCQVELILIHMRGMEAVGC